MKKFLIIDGNNVMFRAYFATASMGNIMRNKNGFPTNMVYGFINIFNKAIQDGYTHVAVAFDKGKKTRRHLLYDEYKAGREKTPTELLEQIPYIFKFLDAINVHYYMEDLYEADDIVGSISNHFSKFFDEIDVLSNDNDLFQLIKPNGFQLYSRMKEVVKYDEKTLFEEKGITPSQVPDYKGLIGDKSDNLVGVEGIGPVTAAKLLKEYKNLENLYEHIDEIQGKTKEKLVNGKESAFFTKKLATLDFSFKFSENEDAFKVQEPNIDKLVQLYTELDFTSLLKKIPKNEIKKEFSYKSINDPFEIDNIIDEEGINSLFLEVLGENYHIGTKVGFGLSNSKGNYYIPYDIALSSFAFTYFLSDNKIKKQVYDYKKMYLVLKKDDIDFSGVDFDLLLASYLINPDLTKDDFSTISYHFGYNEIDFDETIYGKKKRESLPFTEIYESHIAKKAFVISLVSQIAMNEIKENEQESLLKEIEIPLSKTLAKMELNGLRVDKTELDNFESMITKELVNIEKEIYALSGHEFNILSPKQLSTVLFEEIGLKTYKKTKTGYSTDVTVLEELSKRHPIVDLILKYRTLSKLEGTYVQGVRNAIGSSEHIHTIYKQALTDTGRLSSIEPNLQNLPIRKPEAREFRKIFIPEDGSILMSSDYSQIELRVLAHLADEKNLIEAFINKEDIHEATAKAILEKKEVDQEERRSAKAVNFGIIYGISAWGLSQDIGINPKKAEEFIDKYHKSFPRILPFTDKLIDDAQKFGYVSTYFKRRRYIRDIASSKYNLREFAKRTAMNAPIQGTAADILKLAMVKIDRALEENHLHAKLILTIHDEVVLNVPIKEKEKTQELVEKVMTNVVDFKVPLLVEISCGNNLYEAK